MKTFFSKPALPLAGLLIVLCYSCTTVEQVTTDKVEKPTAVEAKPVEAKPTETKPVAVEEKAKERPAVEKAAEQPLIVAEAGNYAITGEELATRLTGELLSNAEKYKGKSGAANAKAVLLKIIVEKAMLIEGRKENLLEGESRLRRFKEQRLTSLLLGTELGGKIRVTDAEIDAKMKANPKWDRARAKGMVEREKGMVLVDQFYKELCEKLNVKKLRDNFAKGVQIHNRLLFSPREERKGYWIKKKQIDEELTPEEKAMVLATFEGGKITLLDWFMRLNEMSPPSRPKDLYTPKGFEQFLDSTMRKPLFIAEAKSRGLDKRGDFLQQLRKYEDRIMPGKVRDKVFAGLAKPTKEEVRAHFDEHKEEFISPNTLKIDQIWCEDLKTAQKVKEELDGGKDFASVREQYSLRKKDKALDTTAAREGIFFEDLWSREPNEVAGPMKGFYRDANGRRSRWLIKWRVVKILGKKAGAMREYSSGVEREVKGRMVREQRDAVMAKYQEELLKKYPYKIYSERAGKINPLDIP